MRILYPDWKYQVETLLALKLPYEANEVIWQLYDEGLSPEKATVRICYLMGTDLNRGAIVHGYHGELRAVFERKRAAENK